MYFSPTDKNFFFLNGDAIPEAIPWGGLQG